MPKLTKADKVAKTTTTSVRLRKEVALADIRELERDEKLKAVVRVEDVRHQWAQILSEVRSAVLRIPDKCGPLVMEANDAREARNILSTECEQVLRIVADEIRKLAKPGDRSRSRRVNTAKKATARRVGKRAPSAKR